MEGGGRPALAFEEAVDGLFGPRLSPREVANALIDELTVVANNS